MLFRIQKLLSTDYFDFEETVLVESPFAQVTEQGFGLRQVQIALTAKNLIIAIDVFNIYATEKLSNVFYHKNCDPEIECMELLTIIPLSYLFIQIYREGCRRLMRVAIGKNKTLFFEFGGFIFQNLYWNIWCDRITTMISLKNSKSDTIEMLATSSSKCSEISNQSNKNSKILRNSSTESNSSTLLPNQKSYLPNHNQQRTLRNVAKLLLETQNDIISNSSQKISCEEKCKHTYYRSASADELFPFWNKGW